MKKIAIVTGASGGIGIEFVALMLEEGVDEIWCVARSLEKLNILRGKFGDKIVPLSFDLSLQESITEISELLKKEQPEVLFLINNAGIGEVLGLSQDVTTQASSKTIQLNCAAVVGLCTVSIPYMKKGGKIINLSSQSSFQPVPYLNLYAATKAFVTSYTRALNMEIKKTGIQATAVCAGWADTEMIPKIINGKEVKYPGLVSPRLVAIKGLADAKRGRDMSVCTVYVKYMRLLAKIFPHSAVMKTWVNSISKYLSENRTITYNGEEV